MKTPIEVVPKVPLSHEALRDTIDLCLWAGQLLIQYGAETQLAEESVHRLGTGLGCDWLDVFISSNALTITASSGVEFRTKTRRIVTHPVNFGSITAVIDMLARVQRGELTRQQVRLALRMISDTPRTYNRWIVIVFVGLACAAFSRLFEGDWPAFWLTWAAAALATFVRQEFSRRSFNLLLVTIATAFTAGVLAGIGTLMRLTETPQIALAAAVLLLVPGVPLINAAEDLIKGHVVTGISRGVWGGLISLAIALGLLIAFTLLGVRGV
ncbi:MAG: threonine/serine exporter family protein [Anaerolineae bacterium]|nr:threonine/serine exporter family protein [Anaerolineae bacterium]